MIRVKYLDSISYGSGNYDAAVFNTSSSSSIDIATKIARNEKNNLQEILSLYLSLNKTSKKKIDEYFAMDPKIRELIEFKCINSSMTQTEVAEGLGISRQTLYNRINKVEDSGILKIISTNFFKEDEDDESKSTLED